MYPGTVTSSDCEDPADRWPRTSLNFTSISLKDSSIDVKTTVVTPTSTHEESSEFLRDLIVPKISVPFSTIMTIPTFPTPSESGTISKLSLPPSTKSSIASTTFYDHTFHPATVAFEKQHVLDLESAISVPNVSLRKFIVDFHARLGFESPCALSNLSSESYWVHYIGTF